MYKKYKEKAKGAKWIWRKIKQGKIKGNQDFFWGRSTAFEEIAEFYLKRNNFSNRNLKNTVGYMEDYIREYTKLIEKDEKPSHKLKTLGKIIKNKL
jgi:hypothetical protein